MLIAALVIAVAVALGGDFMMIQTVRKKPYPAALAQGHWIGGAVAIGVLGLGVIQGAGGTWGFIALALLAAGFAGGWVLFRVLFAGQRPPIWAILAHAALNGFGIVALIVAIIS